MAQEQTYYQRHKEQIKKSQLASYAKHGFNSHSEYQADLRRRRRQELIDFLGGKCVRCGFPDARALQIDHVNGDGHLDRKDNRKYNPAYYARILNEIKQGSKRYQLLCANCNWIKRSENKEL